MTEVPELFIQQVERKTGHTIDRNTVRILDAPSLLWIARAEYCGHYVLIRAVRGDFLTAIAFQYLPAIINWYQEFFL